MIQLIDISKTYTTGNLSQTALDHVSINLRDNEFVAILGPSGSGKTTLLNIIGGLDRYDSGDLVVGGISTKNYKDHDFDSYRNHAVGFVFQSYNLIEHQTVLSNVELALTISGTSSKDRRKRAMDALSKVGLAEQAHKKPSQMSGGQMQRVAIARALVNDPDILLADEPTGALDSETGVQVMELLKEVAKDRLVVMVTHNPDLAAQYATRIVKLYDGKVLEDSNPCSGDEIIPEHKSMGKVSMSFFTSLSLSFNNLRTKKGRTLLTAFAGSIGIIGIALILSLSNGVNNYIIDTEKSTMASYPITIDSETYDISSIITKRQDAFSKDKVDHSLDGVFSNSKSLEMSSSVSTSLTKNNLTAFKTYLDDPNSEIRKYVGENGIDYTYDTKINVYAMDSAGTFINTDGSSFPKLKNSAMPGMAMMSGGSTSTNSSENNNFAQLLSSPDGSISSAMEDSYEVLYGNWPKAYNEVMIVLDENNEISLSTLYNLGFLPADEYKDITAKIQNGEKVDFDTKELSYSDIYLKQFYLVPQCDKYEKDSNGNYKLIADTDKDKLMSHAITLKVSGIIRPYDSQKGVSVNGAVGYTKALTQYLMDYADKSDIVKAQTESPSINVLNGMKFSPSDDSEKQADAIKYLSNLGVSEKAKIATGLMGSFAGAQTTAMDESQLAAALDRYLQNPDPTALLKIYDTYVSSGTYDDNMSTFGVISEDAPTSINIYCDNFENKDKISACIKDYNAGVSDGDKITYTDYVGLLLSSVTTIINVISYILIAFVAVSLIVSSIMIGIITYISVLERTKEIGILRAIGASKKNISQVFNAETFIIGLCSGVIGIGISLLLLLPGNAIIHVLTKSQEVNAALPPVGAVVLIILSMLLTMLGGLIPSKKAARKDPVAALRSE